MITTGNAVFIDLGKNATSFILRVLKAISNSHPVEKSRHQGWREPHGNHYFFTSARNPLKYYVSHYLYQGQNGQVRKSMRHAGWSDEGVPSYIRGILVDRWPMPHRNHKNAERDAMLNMPDDMGYYTMNYILMLDHEWILKRKRTEQEIRDWYARYWFSDGENYDVIQADTTRASVGEQLQKIITENASHFDLDPAKSDRIADGFEAIRDKSGDKVQNLNYTAHLDIESYQTVLHYERIFYEHEPLLGEIH